jgi:Zn-dependent protease
MVWVAAAGPATNFLLAAVSAGMIHLLAFVYPEVDSYIEYIYRQLKPSEFSIILFPLTGMLFYSVILNVVLGVINLIPIPPADGGRIVVGLLPARQAVIYSGIEKYGLLILIVIIMFNPFGITNRLIWPMIIKIVDLLI